MGHATQPDSAPSPITTNRVTAGAHVAPASTHASPASTHAAPASTHTPPATTGGSHGAPSPLHLALAFAALYLIWGSTYLAIRYAVATLPPFLMAGARFILSGVVLFSIYAPRSTEKLTGRHWATTAIVGTLLLLGGNGLVCWAELTVPSGLASLLVATMPLWMVLLDWLVFRGPRPTGRIVAGLTIGLIGVYLLIGESSKLGAGANVKGAVALLCACLFWATGSLIARRGGLPSSSFVATGMEMLAGGAALLIVGLIRGEAAGFEVRAVTWSSWLGWAYLVVFGSLLGFTAYVWLLKVSTPARVSTYAYVNPAIAVMLGALFGDGELNARVLLASGVILSAVVLIVRGSQKKTEKNVAPQIRPAAKLAVCERQG
ncbi:MAG: EamA family transporter [Phycisphaerales bacterium]|nr:EamA family transporter [Phycisphaerales bacterium]